MRFFILGTILLPALVLAACSGPSPTEDAAESDASSADRDAHAARPAEDPATAATDSQPRDTTATAETGPPPLRTPEQVMRALERVNAGFTGPVEMRTVPPENLVELTIHNAKLTNIGPLERMKIYLLDLSGCDVRDLSPLKEQPLVYLYLEENRHLADIEPLRGAPLEKLYLSNTRIENLGPLRGAPLQELNLLGTRVKNVEPLSECPRLEMLWLTHCPVEDISPLSKTPLVSLTVENTGVKDISAFAGHPLQRLHIGGCSVSDLTPLRQMRLTRLIFDPAQVEKGLDAAREMPSLREIGTTFDNRTSPPIFWNQFDAGQNR